MTVQEIRPLVDDPLPPIPPEKLPALLRRTALIITIVAIVFGAILMPILPFAGVCLLITGPVVSAAVLGISFLPPPEELKLHRVA